MLGTVICGSGDGDRKEEGTQVKMGLPLGWRQEGIGKHEKQKGAECAGEQKKQSHQARKGDAQDDAAVRFTDLN